MASTDVVHRLHEQLDWHWRYHVVPRMAGLTDAEYLWEPVDDSWSVRPRTAVAPATATNRAGGGDWLIDYAYPEPDPAPVTTIAWRLAHVIVDILGARAHSHFGGPPADHRTFVHAATADEALDQLETAYGAWSAGVRGLDDDSIWLPVGEAEGPFAPEPMIVLVQHINREAIHHLAEVALLRDLWAHRA